jgi:hypothetical protein
MARLFNLRHSLFRPVFACASNQQWIRFGEAVQVASRRRKAWRLRQDLGALRIVPHDKHLLAFLRWHHNAPSHPRSAVGQLAVGLSPHFTLPSGIHSGTVSRECELVLVIDLVLRRKASCKRAKSPVQELLCLQHPLWALKARAHLQSFGSKQ